MSNPSAQQPSAIFPELILECTAFTRTQLAHPRMPQVAFAGRSNVGKSSLINALAGRKKLAKVSAAPGKTRSINFYRVQGLEAYIVDLPGYGYARRSQSERDKWAELMHYYCGNTPGLRSLILLLDARLIPQKTDKELLAFAAGLSLPVTAVLTKGDKCGKKELAATVRAWEALIGNNALLVSSAHSKLGLEELGKRLLSLLAPMPGEHLNKSDVKF